MEEIITVPMFSVTSTGFGEFDVSIAKPARQRGSAGHNLADLTSEPFSC
jgi:hypothetical protein